MTKTNHYLKVLAALVMLAALTALTMAAANNPAEATDKAKTAVFKLGKVNPVKAVSALTGNLSGSILRIDNNNAGANATALDLQVEPGKAPMTVNSDAQVSNLNADKVDGKDSAAFVLSTTNDFLRNNGVYKRESAVNAGNTLPDGTQLQAQRCDAGDVLLSGGPANVNDTSDMIESYPSAGSGVNSWSARIDGNGVKDAFSVVVLCVNQEPN